MKSKFKKSLMVSLAIAATVALPVSVKAQSDTVAEATPVSGASAEEISAEYGYCVLIPGWGYLCF